jgi:hypothetical protein
MRSYQIIILIGSILGLLIIIGVSTTLGMVSSMFGVPMDQDTEYVYGMVAIGFILYIVNLIIAFIVKNSKAVGVVSIVSSVVILLANGIFGLVGFALLLAGGIVAIAFKNKQIPKFNPDTGERLQ